MVSGATNAVSFFFWIVALLSLVGTPLPPQVRILIVSDYSHCLYNEKFMVRVKDEVFTVSQEKN